MIGAAQFARMKPGAVFINAARGTVVDIDALAQALACGRLAGAAVDVFPVEPKGNAEMFRSPLVGMDNVILTPHVAGSTLEAQDNIGLEVAAKLVRYSDNGSTLSAVNFPEATLPEHPHSRRLLHIHRNMPGMLSRINEVFSRKTSHRRTVPADQSVDRLRGRRRIDQRGAGQRTARGAGRHSRHLAHARAVLKRAGSCRARLARLRR